MRTIFINSFVITLFSCLSMTAQSQSLRGFKSFDLGLGLVSSYAGPCVTGGAFCAGGVRDLNTDFVTALNISSTTVTVVLSREYYQRHSNNLKGGLSISNNFSLPREVSEAFGVVGECTIIGNTTYPIRQVEENYFIELTRVR